MEAHERSKLQQKYDALLFWEGCNSRTHSRSVAVLCPAGAYVIAALDSVHCMTAPKRRARGVSGPGRNRFSVKPFCACWWIVGKVPVVHDATGFCQQAPAPTSLSGRSPLKTNWFSGRVSPMTRLGSVNEHQPRRPCRVVCPENRSVFRARLTLRQAHSNLGSSKIFELMKPFCICWWIFSKVPVVHDATGFCQQAPAPTSLSGRSPLKTNWFSGRVSPMTRLGSVNEHQPRRPCL